MSDDGKKKKKDPPQEPSPPEPGKEPGQGPLAGVTLENLQKRISEAPREPRTKKRGGKAKADIERETAALRQEMEGFADLIIQMGDDWCKAQGITEINPAHKLMLRTGFIGTCMKYDLNVDDYPEAMLLLGGALTVRDKLKELKAKREAEKVDEDVRASMTGGG